MATTQDHTPPRIIHHAPGDRPLCGNESSTAIYSDDPSRVAGCEDCLELVAEDLKDHGWYRGGCVNCLQEISAQGGAAWRRVVREPLLRPRGLVSMTTPTANWPELLKAVVLEVLGQPAEPGVRYAGTGTETRGRPRVHLEHLEERAGNLFSVLLSSGSFSQDWSFSPTTRPWC